MSASLHGAVRVSALAFACGLSLLAIWMSIPEFLRSSFSELPTDAATAETAGHYRTNAIRAARIGLLRGELWTESDIAYAGLFWSRGRSDDPVVAEALVTARGLAETALRYSPHDARAWLLLASFASRSAAPTSEVLAAMKMSYYTGSNEIGLIPMRLLVATRADAFGDEEIRGLITRDIRLIMRGHPDLRGTISLAYRESAPNAKALIEAALEDLDPKFLASLRSANAGKSEPNR